MASLLKQAIALAGQGISVFPLNVKKRPMGGSNGHKGCQHRSGGYPPGVR